MDKKHKLSVSFAPTNDALAFSTTQIGLLARGYSIVNYLGSAEKVGERLEGTGNGERGTGKKYRFLDDLTKKSAFF